MAVLESLDDVAHEQPATGSGVAQQASSARERAASTTSSSDASTSSRSASPPPVLPRASQNKTSRGLESKGEYEEDDDGSSTSESELDALERRTLKWTDDEIKDAVRDAREHKTKGNAEFGKGKYALALETYRTGLAALPPVRLRTRKAASTRPAREGKGKSRADDADASEKSEEAKEEEQELGEPVTSDSKLASELAELRCMLNANIAASCNKMEMWKDAVVACEQALEDKPGYLKALHRRALANEAIHSWSSLQGSLDDFKALATHADAPPTLRREARAACERLPREIQVQQEKEKDEVLGKLKDLGNMFLGKFGLSTDNFQFNQQPGGGGGYSMNYQQ